MRRQNVPSALAGIIAGALLVGASATARADLPPPDGQKFVGYSFTVVGLAAIKDFVLLAYPCGGSNGVPSADMVEIKEGVSVSVGRRGGNCKLYSMGRADFDTWRAANKSNTSDAVSALFNGSKVHACTGGPEVNHVLPSSDARTVATQALNVAQLDATGCSITSGGQPAARELPSTGAPPTETPPVNRGCAACSVEAPPVSSGALAAGLALMGLALGRRAKRSR